MRYTAHSRQRVIERAQGSFREIAELIRTRSTTRLRYLPPISHNRKVVVIKLKGEETKPVVAIFAKSTHKIITVIEYSQYKERHAIPEETDNWACNIVNENCT